MLYSIIALVGGITGLYPISNEGWVGASRTSDDQLMNRYRRIAFQFDVLVNQIGEIDGEFLRRAELIKNQAGKCRDRETAVECTKLAVEVALLKLMKLLLAKNMIWMG